MIPLPTFDEVYRQGQNIRLHGNRFIQVDMLPLVRMHFWSDLIPRAQQRPAPIHSHDYGFESTILSGQLLNIIYRVTETGRQPHATSNIQLMYDIYTVDRDNGLLVPNALTCVLKAHHIEYYRAGMSYRMRMGQIHGTAYIGHAITVLHAEPRQPFEIQVFVPKGVEPDNDYRRDQIPADQLWEIVREIYNSTPR